MVTVVVVDAVVILRGMDSFFSSPFELFLVKWQFSPRHLPVPGKHHKARAQGKNVWNYLYLKVWTFFFLGKSCNMWYNFFALNFPLKQAFWIMSFEWPVFENLKLLCCALLCLFAQMYPTPCNPMNHSPPCSSDHGILQARILEWVAIPFSRGIFPTQGLNQGLLHCRWILYLFDFNSAQTTVSFINTQLITFNKVFTNPKFPLVVNIFSNFLLWKVSNIHKSNDSCLSNDQFITILFMLSLSVPNCFEADTGCNFL